MTCRRRPMRPLGRRRQRQNEPRCTSAICTARRQRLRPCLKRSGGRTGVASAGSVGPLGAVPFPVLTRSIGRRVAACAGCHPPSRTDYFTFADVRTALYEYIAREQLVDRENPRLVVLDPFLAEHLVPKNDRSNSFKLPRDALASTYVRPGTPTAELRTTFLTIAIVFPGGQPLFPRLARHRVALGWHPKSTCSTRSRPWTAARRWCTRVLHGPSRSRWNSAGATRASRASPASRRLASCPNSLHARCKKSWPPALRVRAASGRNHARHIAVCRRTLIAWPQHRRAPPPPRRSCASERFARASDIWRGGCLARPRRVRVGGPPGRTMWHPTQVHCHQGQGGQIAGGRLYAMYSGGIGTVLLIPPPCLSLNFHATHISRGGGGPRASAKKRRGRGPDTCERDGNPRALPERAHGVRGCARGVIGRTGPGLRRSGRIQIQRRYYALVMAASIL